MSEKPHILTGPFHYFRPSQTIFMKHPKFGDVQVLNVRSWGFLTGHGEYALKLDRETAAAEQDRFGEWVAQSLNRLAHETEAGT